MANFLKNLFDKKARTEKVDIARRFELLARVGQGSMSKVWRARDVMTGRMLAVKLLDKAKTERFEARFVGLNKPSEGQIAVSLQHPNIARTLEFGITTEEEQYLVMEFIEGLSLSYLVDTQNQQMKDNCLNYILQIGEGLDYIHKQNWIHRDLCPRNVMVDQDNMVKLIDFGLMVPNTPDFQKPGNRTGTANYMAPELIKRQRTDQRIDIFSLSVTAYEMYTRRLPWEVTEQQTLDTVLQHINKPPTPITELVPDIDPRVAEIIMKGLAPNPDDRWQSVAEMLIPLRKVHEELEAKQALQRRIKAAAEKAKGKESSASTATKNQKLAAQIDDDFVNQILLGDGITAPKPMPANAPARKTEPIPQQRTAPAANAAATTKPMKSPKPTAPTSSPTKSAVAGGKSKSGASSPGQPKKPKTFTAAPTDDEFDGIEIEVEGHKLDESSSTAIDATNEFDGIEIEVEGTKLDLKAEDEFEGIEIEHNGDEPAARREPPAARDRRKLAAILDESDQQECSRTMGAGTNEDDDEPVLRLPDDEES